MGCWAGLYRERCAGLQEEPLPWGDATPAHSSSEAAP